MRWRPLNQICIFRAKRRIADNWRHVGPIQIDQMIARPNLYNILEVSIFKVEMSRLWAET